ncbi:stress enhanced protein 2, chloroplastic-like [Silene latifolia]|uniref:stress enhanced protein 2, chloroplastic-like n=1 Tax=Silene latifolia TaxID=37657 RepID=UPI003D773BAB
MASISSARVIHCELQPPKQAATPRTGLESPDQVKIILQPRLCTLRSYGPSDREGGLIKTLARSKDVGGSNNNNNISSNGREELMSPFLANLYEYIESSKKSQDFEIITGRLAMIVFAATIYVELATGNSVFKKMDLQGLEEGLGACLAAVACAASFAYSTSARKKVGRIFSISCNAFIDTLIDNIVDGLFFDDSDADDDQSQFPGQDL